MPCFSIKKTVSETIIDNSVSLQGVSIVIQITNTGTESDFDAKYTINANSRDVLVFKYWITRTIKNTVGNSANINVKLKEAANVLD